MKRTIQIQPLAQVDLRQKAEFIAKDRLNAALRLLEAVEVTCRPNSLGRHRNEMHAAHWCQALSVVSAQESLSFARGWIRYWLVFSYEVVSRLE